MCQKNFPLFDPEVPGTGVGQKKNYSAHIEYRTEVEAFKM